MSRTRSAPPASTKRRWINWARLLAFIDHLELPDRHGRHRNATKIAVKIIRYLVNREENARALARWKRKTWVRDSVRYIARQVKASPSQVCRMLQRLVRAGIIVREMQTTWHRTSRVTTIGADGSVVDELQPAYPRRDISLTRFNPFWRSIAGLPVEPDGQVVIDAQRTRSTRLWNWGIVDGDPIDSLRNWRKRSPGNPFLREISEQQFLDGLHVGDIPRPRSAPPPR